MVYWKHNNERRGVAVFQCNQALMGNKESSLPCLKGNVGCSAWVYESKVTGSVTFNT